MEELQKYFVSDCEIIKSDVVKVDPKAIQGLIEANRKRDYVECKHLQNITSTVWKNIKVFDRVKKENDLIYCQMKQPTFREGRPWDGNNDEFDF